MIKTFLVLIICWYGLMLGCVLQFTNDSVSVRDITKAVILHDIKFLNKNCDYKKARIMCVVLFLLMNLIGNILSAIL